MSGEGITITFVGGPADGRTYAIPNSRPPLVYLIPIEQPIASLFSADAFDLQPMRAAEYEPLLDNGWPSRTSDGTYRYGYRATPEPPHPGQSQPTPTLDELAAMHADPPRTAYPDSRSHLLACRTRYSLRRDARMSEAERQIIAAATWDHIRKERPDFPERRPF